MRLPPLFALLLVLLIVVPAHAQDGIVIHDSLEIAVMSADSSEQTLGTSPRYPVGRMVGTVVAGNLAQAGGFFAGGYFGGLIAKPFVKASSGEWGGLELLPYVFGGAVLGDLAGGSLVIHAINQKYVRSSPWHACLGMTVHFMVGFGLLTLINDQKSQDAAATTMFLTAPITGTAAYYLFGRPRSRPAPRKSIHE